MAKDVVILITAEHTGQKRRVERDGGIPDLINGLERVQNGQNILKVMPLSGEGRNRLAKRCLCFWVDGRFGVLTRLLEMNGNV